MERAIVAIGASHAGVQFVASLREQGHTGQITLVSDEPDFPYHKPPLSKAFMKGTASVESLNLRGPHFFQSAGIDFRRGLSAIGIDRAARQVRFSDGSILSYDVLMLATGARPRVWAGQALPHNVSALRSLNDARRLHNAVADTVGPIVVVGGGYVSLELAATWCMTTGRDITIVNSASRLLARSASPELAAVVENRFRAHGVGMRMGVQARQFTIDASGNARGVVLSDGTEIPASLVVLGTGVLPNQELALAAGLPCDGGILVDEQCRTADRAIFAAGDCTRHFNGYAGRQIRLECVQNAHDQARVAAAVICGQDARYHQVPWFWSDQFDMKFQTVGLLPDTRSLCVTRGTPRDGKGAYYHYDMAGKLAAIETVNMPAEHMLGRKLLSAGMSVSADRVADPAFNIRQLL
ncbi:NAD(P)/FAD-dependent oxidoreductase (plasmid) [Komagataeibacter sucrofermentans]|uniref:Pyridine nucleotide-disulfide oxidoreductase n=1 Tax=Komagataeibacter sucrofermentans TaxID=1053551 RepID=A0A318QDC6_9PROT|nr:FAD-dependent oxidoreductase [Komagataeibacter sucrofermentans]PYD77627.1 hypothetical protein CFR77_14470 [Komagataeibacter sucrofermentans]GBQ47546.1 putative NAD/FAD-dependent oxidoreductase [Komagataeibacter sucrofermentans DSM 15973]